MKTELFFILFTIFAALLRQRYQDLEKDSTEAAPGYGDTPVHSTEKATRTLTH